MKTRSKVDSKKKNRVAIVLWRIFSIMAVVLWGMLIFGFSAQEAEESSRLSEKVSYAIADEYNTVFRQQMSEHEVWRVAGLLEYPVRKIAHMSEYAVFALLIFQLQCAFSVKGKKKYWLSVLVIFAYACTDEFHQLYVSGRSGQFWDVLIDTTGGAFMMLLAALIAWGVHHHKDKKE